MKIDNIHKIPVQIRFSDIDGIGHVNNVKYNEYFDIGRLHYLEEVFGRTLNWGDRQTLVLVHTEADYRHPTFLYDTVEVHTSVTEIGERSIRMKQRIVDTHGVVRVEGLSILSTFDMETGKSFPIPEEWKEKMANYVM
jgi:acyl-CoA thioester hydrolase